MPDDPKEPETPPQADEEPPSEPPPFEPDYGLIGHMERGGKGPAEQR